MWNKVDEKFEQSERQARLERQKQWRKEFLSSIQLDVSSTRAIVRHVSHLLKVLDKVILEKGVKVKDVESFYVNPDTGDVVIYDYCEPDSNVTIFYSDYATSRLSWLSSLGLTELKEDDVRNIIASLKVYIQNSKLPIGKGYSYRFEGGYVWIHKNGPYSDVLAKISLSTGRLATEGVSCKKILNDFVKGFFPNEYESLKEDIEEGNISNLVDVQQEIDCGSQVELLESFEYWVSNEYSYSKETTINILELVKGVFSDWNNYSISEGEDDFYYVERILKGKSKLSYTVAHSSGGPKHYIRDVVIKFK